MAGFWPSSSHLDQTSLVNKGFIVWLSGKFFLWDMVGSPKQTRYRHLACSGSQSQCRIWFILPAHGASHIIRLSNTDLQITGKLIKYTVTAMGL